jgi:alpha-N-acetylglucosaminidase
MTPPSGELEYLERLSRAIYHGMIDSDPQAVWVLQGWAFMYQRQFWTQDRIRAFLDAVPHDRMVVLDLFCEARPMWNETEAFCGKPWLWCNIQNFGDTVFLGGPLNTIATDLPAARRHPDRGRLVGLGFVNEGLGYNPVVHDLMFEMAWRDAGRCGHVSLRPGQRRPAGAVQPCGRAASQGGRDPPVGRRRSVSNRGE